MPWGLLLGIVSTPAALALGLWMGWVQAFTIPVLEANVTRLKAETARLDKAIEDPKTGWRFRLKLAEDNVGNLRGAVSEQNDRIAAIAAAKAESDKRIDERIAAAEAQRDEFERRVTAYQNIVPQEDIPEQAINLIRGRFGRL